MILEKLTTKDTHEIIKDFATDLTKIYGMEKDKKNEQESDYG